MARQFARKLRMHPDDNELGDETSDGDNHDDDDKKWFYEPMDYVDFKESLRGMETEEEQESLRREACEHKLEDDTEIETECNSDSHCDPVDDEEVGDICQIVKSSSRRLPHRQQGGKEKCYFVSTWCWQAL